MAQVEIDDIARKVLGDKLLKEMKKSVEYEIKKQQEEEKLCPSDLACAKAVLGLPGC
ncbi:MAG: hypothetical protein K9M15_02465 [Candidatus Marinimicrobia bacterium]|nr:hypothetical protein [Candidatus Neomarinimicrobiota bacterium]